MPERRSIGGLVKKRAERGSKITIKPPNRTFDMKVKERPETATATRSIS